MPLNFKVPLAGMTLCCFMLAGCGGKSAAPKAPVLVGPANPAAAGPQANPAPAIANQQPGPQAVAGAANDGQNTAATVAPAEEELPPAGPDDFQIVPMDTVLEVAGTFREPPPAPVDVVSLPTGQNSSTLEIVDANPTDGAATSPAGIPSTPGRASPGVNPTVPTAVSANKRDESGDWNLPEGATAVPGAGTDLETGLPLRITLERDPVEMVLIAPGVFLEGADGQDPNAAPQHSVLLENPYYIDVVEVTVARHDAFREFYRKTEGRKMEPATNHDGNPDAPAVGIKFLDAKFYAKWTGKELPTEAQWERAARGDHGYEYPWGNGRPIFHQARQPGQLDPAKTFPGDCSPYGVYDTAGNAREWCLDIYSPDGFQKQAGSGGSPVRNPTGPKTFQGTKLQVVKGGKSDWAVWQRAGVPTNETARDIGFRCVLNISSDLPETEKSTTSKATDKPAAKGVDKKKKKAVGL